MLGVAMGVGGAIARIDRRRLRLLAGLVTAIVAVDVMIQARLILEQTFVIPWTPLTTTPLRGAIQQYDGQQVPTFECRSWLYPMTALGRGVIRGYEPLVAKHQYPIGAIGTGRPDYRGEFGPAGEVRQISWSPRRIVLEGPPGASFWINQNAGSYWRVNGQRPFGGSLVVDRTRRLEGQLDASGRAEVVVDPPLRGMG